jgi:hypothetical protein
VPIAYHHLITMLECGQWRAGGMMKTVHVWSKTCHVRPARSVIVNTPPNQGTSGDGQETERSVCGEDF